MVFEELEKEKLPHEQIVFCNDHKTGLKAIIAIHNTQLGPSLGGCRMYPYKTEKEALRDVLNLSRAMSYKAACSGLELGGGKSVIIGDPDKDKTKEILSAFGKYIQSLNGKYIVAKDVGIFDQDLKHIGETTSYVIGKPREDGGAGSPSYSTAKGVFLGLKLGVQLRLQKTSLKNIKVVIEGVGSVGFELMKLLVEEEAEVFVFDVKKEILEKVKKAYPSVHILSQKEVYHTPCDVFSPCALGGVINETNLKTLNCSLIAGGANNQLHSIDMCQKLFDKNILYLPDFILNSGGLIHVSGYLKIKDKPPENWIENKLQEIPKSLKSIYDFSKKQHISMTEAALNLGQTRIIQGYSLKN